MAASHIELVVEKLFGTVTGKRLAILGFPSRLSTTHAKLRRFASAAICWKGAQLAIHDPKVAAQQMVRDLQQEAAPKADSLSGIGSWLQAGSVEEL